MLAKKKWRQLDLKSPTSPLTLIFKFLTPRQSSLVQSDDAALDYVNIIVRNKLCERLIVLQIAVNFPPTLDLTDLWQACDQGKVSKKSARCWENNGRGGEKSVLTCQSPHTARRHPRTARRRRPWSCRQTRDALLEISHPHNKWQGVFCRFTHGKIPIPIS